MRTRLPTVALGAVMILIAGCGGGSSTGASNSASVTNAGSTTTTATSTTAASTGRTASSSSGKPLPRPQLIARAVTICRRLNSELDSRSNVIRNTQDIVRLIPQRAAREQVALSELSSLTPPAKIAHDYRQMLAA